MYKLIVFDWNGTLCQLSWSDQMAGRPPRLYGGVLKLLDALREEYTLAIATNASRPSLELHLEQLNVKSYFETWQTASDGLGKPHPDMLYAIMEQCAVSPSETLVVGDGQNDIEMAITANVAAVGIAEEGNEQPLLDAGAVAVIPHVRALLDWL